MNLPKICNNSKDRECNVKENAQKLVKVRISFFLVYLKNYLREVTPKLLIR